MIYPLKRILIFCLVLFCLFLFPLPVLANKITPEQLQQIEQKWSSSVHALQDINCSSCHQDEKTKALVKIPTEETCKTCHDSVVGTFLLGKHGIRTLEGLSPLTPAMAHLPMKKSAMGKVMNCNTCHDVHSANTYVASVDSCLTCHNDNHSLNYKNSRHGEIFANIGTLPRTNTESVTCATCHLPRQKINETVMVNHNNTYTLLPRDRMVKEVCMNCHSTEYAYNSIFDDELVEANFDRPPTQKMQTFDLVRALEKKRLGKTSSK